VPENEPKNKRRSIRLPEHDYSKQGLYFLTICVKDHLCLLGKIENGDCVLSQVGRIVKKNWMDIPNAFPRVILDDYVIMPNHIHGIIILAGHGRGLINQTPTGNDDKWILMKNPKQTLGKIVRHFKARSAKQAHDAGGAIFKWQRNYWEHIIRNEKSYYKIKEYMHQNPLYWSQDEENPGRR